MGKTTTADAGAVQADAPFAERVARLYRELERAIRFDRPSILLAVYSSRFVLAQAKAALETQLQAQGQRVAEFFVTPERYDVPALLAEHPQRENTVFFVYALSQGGGEGGRNAYRALNLRREFLVEARLRLVFWLTEGEAVNLPAYAPDFWAFRHRVVEFVETPPPGRVMDMARAAAWHGLDARTLRENTAAKIALREALLADLPPGEETRASRATLLYTLAGLYWARQDLDYSLTLWQQALQETQALADVSLQSWCWNGLGNVYDDLQRYEEAIAAYQQAIARDPQDAYPWNGLGNVYRDLKRYEEAIAAYQQAIERDAQSAYPWNGLGNVYGDLKRYEEAIAAYQQAIERDPQFAWPWNNLGLVYRDLQRYEEAIAAYQQAIERDPQYATPWHGLGSVYRNLQRYEEAIAAYQQAIARDPQFAYPWNGLGNVYGDLKRYEEAIAAYQQAIERDPQFAWPWNNLGAVYRDLKRYEEAIAAYQQAIERDPQFATPWNNLGAVYRDLKRYDEAIAAFQQAIRLDARFAYPYNNLADIHLRRREINQATECYNQRILLSPDDALNAHVQLGLIYIYRGNKQKAAEQFETALALWRQAWERQLQTRAGLLENKAWALYGLGETSKAVVTLKEALAQRLPGDVIDLDTVALLNEAPDPPPGLEEMRLLLEKALSS